MNKMKNTNFEITKDFRNNFGNIFVDKLKLSNLANIAKKLFNSEDFGYYTLSAADSLKWKTYDNNISGGIFYIIHSKSGLENLGYEDINTAIMKLNTSIEDYSKDEIVLPITKKNPLVNSKDLSLCVVDNKIYCIKDYMTAYEIDPNLNTREKTSEISFSEDDSNSDRRAAFYAKDKRIYKFSSYAFNNADNNVVPLALSTLEGTIFSSNYAYPTLSLHNDNINEDMFNSETLQIYADIGIITALNKVNNSIITGHMTGDIYMIPRSRMGEMSSIDRLKKNFIVVNRPSIVRGLDFYNNKLLDCGDYNSMYLTDLNTHKSELFREFPPDYTCLALGVMPTSETMIELTPSNISRYGENNL